MMVKGDFDIIQVYTQQTWPIRGWGFATNTYFLRPSNSQPTLGAEKFGRIFFKIRSTFFANNKSTKQRRGYFNTGVTEQYRFDG